MAELERCLIEAADARTRLIATDGVFSMDGIIADLAGICDLADKHDALVMVDDSHAVGFVGANGRGSPEHCGVEGRIDILTGTLGKALGGASGGYTAARREVVELLRQRSRPYLFSNTLAPGDRRHLAARPRPDRGRRRPPRPPRRQRRQLPRRDDRARLHPRRRRPPDRPGDPRRRRPRPATSPPACSTAASTSIGFSFPVVPRGQARIRTQMSAAHTPEDVATAIAAFAATGRELGVIA